MMLTRTLRRRPVLRKLSRTLLALTLGLSGCTALPASRSVATRGGVTGHAPVTTALVRDRTLDRQRLDDPESLEPVYAPKLLPEPDSPATVVFLGGVFLFGGLTAGLTLPYVLSERTEVGLTPALLVGVAMGGLLASPLFLVEYPFRIWLR